MLIVKGGWNKTTCKLELKYMYSRVQRVVSIDDKPVREGILECWIMLCITVQLIQSCFKQNLLWVAFNHLLQGYFNTDTVQLSKMKGIFLDVLYVY